VRRLLLLRHGRTSWNADGRAQGHADIGLDATGRSQAERVAPAVAAYRPVVLWTSDLARARETTAYVAEATGLEPTVDARLREYAVGTHRTGLTLAEYAGRFPAEHADLAAGRDHLVPGRETDGDVLARFVPALTELAGVLGPDDCGVAVSHGHSLKTGTAAFLGWPPDIAPTLAGLDNCAWVELEQSGSSVTGAPARWRLAAYNRQAEAPDFASDAPVG